MKVKVDEELCEGCGVCSDVAPDVFELNDDDKAVVIANPVPDDQEDAVRDAADQCPTEAILIEE